MSGDRERGVRSVLLLVGAGLLVLALIRAGQTHTYSDQFGNTGTCGSVFDGSGKDTILGLDVPGANSQQLANYCDGTRSSDRAVAGTLALIGVLLLLGGTWAHKEAERLRIQDLVVRSQRLKEFGPAPDGPPGWYPDPEHHGFVRQWDGFRWKDAWREE